MEATQALGMAELTERITASADNRNDIPRIIRYALELSLLWMNGDGRDKVRETLDTLNALEAQLESIGAGGVSGPLMGAAPPTAQAEGWTKLPGQLPEPGMPVLLDIGKKYPIRAMWAAKHTVQAADDDTDWGEYVEEDDMYYAPEGWYEWNQCEDNHWRVTETPRAWMPLPPTSAEGVEHG